MRSTHKTLIAAAVLLLAAGVPWLAKAAASGPTPLHLPWKEAGLTERQAAAHLLSRFTYGPRPGDVDKVVALGLDRWFEQQLQANLPDPQVAERLRPLQALAMSNEEIFRRYPPNGMILAEMRREGLLPGKKAGKDDTPQTVAADLAGLDKKELRQKTLAYSREKGYLPEKQLLGQVMTQKLVRAVYSENQLAEVMTDFWFNHFNVSLTNNKVRPYLLSYERDAIRPNVLGHFRDLLEATARHPAMLVYLDNAQSSAAMEAPTTMAGELERRRAFNRRPGRFAPQAGAGAGAGGKGKKEHGLNENYARELMELHTLGVDGGYTQEDVIAVARAFTGWTVLPPGPARQQAENRLARVQRVGGLGFQEQGDFLFRADTHDASAKVVLGQTLPAGRGIEDGEQVLDVVAAHKATARHLATQIAARFVADQPPPALVDRLAAVYTRSQGDVRQILRALVESPELWSPAARGVKIKSPFELAASALRAVDGDLRDPKETLQWVAKIGQPLYAYQAPTGYPDRAESWVNTGSLLNRMNFGLQLAAGRVRGVKVDLAALNGGKEPESREQALHTYAGLLMPERDLTEAMKVLKPMVSQPDLAQKIDEATPAPPDTKMAKAGESLDDEEEMIFGDKPVDAGDSGGPKGARRAGRPKLDEPTPVEQVVGVILGSPEFQRR
ncbi:MAG TPA: DUF1800 domain-containing protein [Thermoanaerobaculia bacterium]|nr:DUF1800 domain-containing protein [Thermoanaerobaculia bacterium]